MTDTQASEWTDHDGRGIPVGKCDLVEVRCRDGWQSRFPTPAHEWMDHAEETDGMWVHRGIGTDILVYRMVKP